VRSLLFAGAALVVPGLWACAVCLILRRLSRPRLPPSDADYSI
jgi:hypothetical protein